MQAAHLMAVNEKSPTYEMASVLFMDIVGYSLQPMDRQTELLSLLQKIVRETADFQQAQSRNELISCPTGDGMALVFLQQHPIVAAKCALEVAASLHRHPEIQLRMGIHSGPICRHADIKNEVNVVGGGINMAQRVMDCGDAGHILLSRNVAEVLEQLGGWRECLRDLGEQTVKHDVKVHLYNLCRDGLGNPALPRKIAPAGRASWRGPLLLAAVGIALLTGGGVVAYQFMKPASVRPVAPRETRSLRYYVIVQKVRNGRSYEQPFRSNGDRIFEAGYQIRLVFSSRQTGYLYILNESPSSTRENPVYIMQFPSPKTNDGSARLEPARELAIPDKDQYLEFDKKKGLERLWVISSKEKLAELEELDRGAIGDINQRRAVQTFLTKYSGAPPKLERDEADEITTLTGNGDVLVHLIKLQHE